MLTQPPRPVMAWAFDAATTTGSLARYWCAILTLARRELRRWERRARAIPDPLLREQALATLAQERLNAEAAAVFATLAAPASWGALVPLLVAFEVMFDYLDTLSEQPAPEPFERSCRLHLALAAALDPELDVTDYYALHPRSADGGYLAALVARCRLALPRLPAWDAVAPFARRAAERCALGQSHTHAAADWGERPLARWALAQERAHGYHWWELAAGAISSVSVFAQMAGATDPRTTAADAAMIDAAYFPAIGALSALLDSFVDRDDDRATANANTFAPYASDEEAAARLALIARRAVAAARGLRHGRRHVAIVAGVAAYYLSAVDPRAPARRLLADALREAIGPAVLPILATMRARRQLKRLGRGDSG